jgi:excisionase family DNA binding protein
MERESMTRPQRPPQQLDLFRSSVFIDASRAAKILKRSVKSVYRLLEAGHLRGYRTPPRGWYQISYDSVTEFMMKMMEQCYPELADQVHSERLPSEQATSPKQTDRFPLVKKAVPLPPR